MTRDLIKQLKEIIEKNYQAMIPDQGRSGEDRDLICLINRTIADVQKYRGKFSSLKSKMLSDIDCLAEVLGKISLGNFDMEIPSMRVPDMDTVRIGIIDMKAKLKEGSIERDEKEKALRDLKVLSGLIPICASCKRIRDDEGSWGQMEAYIQEHSEAEFSHGICHDCAKKLYPDYFDGSEI